MKKIKIITVIAILITMLLQNVIVIANVINLGETKYVERGDLGFYTIQYWNESKQQWMYVTYSRTYYTDDSGEKRIAYCTSPDLDGVGWLPNEVDGYNTTITKKLTDTKLWRVFKNGYPYVSPAELGVENDDDAYLATKQATYFILRQRNASEVYSYFRAGDKEINGQKLDDIQRRGKKVVDAIYKLVNIAQNGEQTMNDSQVNPIGEFSLDNNSNFYSKKYIITKTGNDVQVKINNIEGAPDNTFSADVNGNKKDTFYSGDIFKIMIPKENIFSNCYVSIKYTSTCKNYPVYYAKSTRENTQDYLMMAETYENKDLSTSFTINGFTSNLKIKKIDSDTKEPIEGVKFKIDGLAGMDGYKTYITDKNGEIELKNIRQAKIVLHEIETKENYVLDTAPKEIYVGYNQSYNMEIENSKKRGSIELTKVDKDDNSKVLPNVEFDLIDNNGNVVIHKATDESGKLLFENIDVGEYTLKETKASEGYRLANDEKVNVTFGEKIKITIKDEHQKGKIKVVKTDKDNKKIKLANVKFEILDKNKNYISNITTNENGEAISEELIIGKYYLKEINTNEDYILSQNLKEVNVEDNTNSEINVENEKKKGQIKIIKKSEDANNVTHSEAGNPIENVKFGIYYFNGNLAQEVTTNKEGVAVTNNLTKGKYKIKELDAGKWYVINENTFDAEIKENDDIVEINIGDKSVDPKVEVKKLGPEIAKINNEVRYDFDIKNIGNVALSNFTWYDFLPYEKSKITKISTGTYNQEIIYNIYYKTNKKADYMVLAQNLNSNKNNFIDVSNIYLENDEKITEIKFDFGNVKIRFAPEEKPYMLIKADENIEDGTALINETILEGYYDTYKVSAEDTVNTTIENKAEEVKRLPRTGF